jgi:hypothetical protein
MVMIAATAPSHRTATAMTFAETTHKIANMVAMLTHHASRLKMPRPGAYSKRSTFKTRHRDYPGAQRSRPDTEAFAGCTPMRHLTRFERRRTVRSCKEQLGVAPT